MMVNKRAESKIWMVLIFIIAIVAMLIYLAFSTDAIKIILSPLGMI